MSELKHLEGAEQRNSAVTEPANQPSGPGRRMSAGETPPVWRRRRYTATGLILQALRLYGLIACLGVAVTVAIRPDLLGSPLSAWWPEVRRDVLAAFCVLLSCAAWAGLRFLDRPHRRRDDE